MATPLTLSALEKRLTDAQTDDIDLFRDIATELLGTEHPDYGIIVGWAASGAYESAALALVSRVLPEYAVTVTRFSSGIGCAKLWTGGNAFGDRYEVDRAPTPALAVCLALVRAMTARDPAVGE